MVVRAVRPFQYNSRDIGIGQAVDMPDTDAAAFIRDGVAVPAGVMTRTSMPWI